MKPTLLETTTITTHYWEATKNGYRISGDSPAEEEKWLIKDFKVCDNLKYMYDVSIWALPDRYAIKITEHCDNHGFNGVWKLESEDLERLKNIVEEIANYSYWKSEFLEIIDHYEFVR